jgi:uncharacterized protein (TIGR01777 family)
MQKNILITGGTGLVGTRLSDMLIKKGYQVNFLSRQAGEGKIKKYRWDLKTKYIDENALKTADHIIHLAGAGVFDKRWSPSYKKEILDSRVQSTTLLYEKLSSISHHVKSFISASAIGIYGFDTGDRWLTEDSPTGEGFLAEVTSKWEASMLPIENSGLRTVRIRVGIVLSDQGGALEELSKPVKFFIGSPMGRGSQYVSWIHIDDLCSMFILAIENEKMAGAYNAAAPEPVSNAFLTKEIASVLKKPLWMPNVPAFVLKLILGSEKAAVLLGGNRVSPKKIIEAGFKFSYPVLKPALEQLLKNNK